MAASVYGIYAVGKAKSRFGKAMVVLQGYFYNGAVRGAGYVNGQAVEDWPVLIETADKAGYAAFEEERCLLGGSLIFLSVDLSFPPNLGIEPGRQSVYN